MKVENATSVKIRELKRKPADNATGGADFSAYLAEETTNALAPASPATIALLPEDSDYRALDQTLKENAHSALKMMKTLQAEILQGVISLDNLNHLSAYVHSQQAKTTDFALRNILQAIKTRAAVEIAKLEVRN
jgi:hypothetical protein